MSNRDGVGMGNGGGSPSTIRRTQFASSYGKPDPWVVQVTLQIVQVRPHRYSHRPLDADPELGGCGLEAGVQA